MLFELENIHFGYDGRSAIFDDLSFKIGAGEKVALTGRNGAGKSTLFHLMLGFHKSRAGQISAFGQVRQREDDFVEVRRRAGLVFQDADDQLFCPSVIDDLAFGPLNSGDTQDEAIAKGEAILRRFDLLALRDRAIYSLSGGEKQLISLLSVLVMECEILLLDEPSNALDPYNEALLLDILKACDLTLFFITHEPRWRDQLASRVLTLQNGRLLPS